MGNAHMPSSSRKQDQEIKCRINFITTISVYSVLKKWFACLLRLHIEVAKYLGKDSTIEIKKKPEKEITGKRAVPQQDCCEVHQMSLILANKL